MQRHNKEPCRTNDLPLTKLRKDSYNIPFIGYSINVTGALSDRMGKVAADAIGVADACADDHVDDGAANLPHQ